MNPEDVGTMARQIAGIPEPGPREFLPTLATWERMLRDDAGFEGVARGRGIYDRFSKAAEVVPRDMLTQKTRRDIFVQDLTGATPEDIATGIPQMKVAKGLFGIDDPSDEAFDAAMNQWVGEKVATRDLVAQMARRVTDAAIQNKPLEVLLKEAKAETGEKFPLVESVMREAHARVLGEFSPEQIRVADGLFGQVAAMEGADVETQEMFAPFGDYLRMDQAGREKVLSAIAMRAESEGQDVEGFFAQKAAALRSGAAFTSLGLFTRAKRSEAAALRQVAERGTVPATWGENWMDTAELSVWVRQTEEATFGGAAGVIRDAAAAINPEAFEKQVKLTDEQKNVLLDRADEIEGQAVFAADLVSSGVKIKRYISEEKGKFFILSSLNRYLTMAAESAPMMATMAAPYGGGLVVYGTSAREVNMAELRRETGQAELNEGQKMVATVAAVLEAGVERLQFLTLGARVPRLKAATLRIPIVGKPANWVGKAAAVTGLESGQEVVQDLTKEVVQSLASALSEDIPGVAWGEVLEREMQALPDIIGVSMVFGVIGATVSSVVDYFNRDAVKAHLTNQDWIESRGIPAEVAQQISELAQTNVGAAAETLKAEMMERPLDERKKNAEAWVDRKAQSIEQALKGRRRAELPEIVRNDDGTPGVRYPDGTVVPTETLDGAVELMREWQLNDDAIMERTARELAQMLTQSHQGNPLLNVEASFTGEQMTMTTREWAGDAKISIEKARERVRTALRDEGMNPDEVAAIGDEHIDQMRITVRGSSTNRILGDTTTIAMKIHKSGRVDTVLEEHAEGVAKWILQSKKMSEAEMIRNLRETERMLGIDRLGNVEEMTPELRGQAIAESFSYLAVANFFGKVPEARNLSDRFKMFLRALRDAFAAILETAAGIRQLSEQGKLDADFERYLDIAGGLDTGYVKDGLDRQAEQEIRETLSLAKDEEELGPDTAPGEPGQDGGVEEIDPDKEGTEIKWDDETMSVAPSMLPEVFAPMSKEIYDRVRSETETLAAIHIDRMKVGEYAGIPLQGGMFYPAIQENLEKGVVWAFNAPNVARSVARRAAANGGYVKLVLMQEGNVVGNRTFTRIWFRELRESIAAGRISKTRALKEINAIRKRHKESTGHSRAFKTLDEAEEAIFSMPQQKRGGTYFQKSRTVTKRDGEKIAYQSLLSKKNFTAIGFPDAAAIVSSIEEESFKGVPTGAVVGLIQIDPIEEGSDIPTAKDMGVPEHISYGWVLKGKPVARMMKHQVIDESFPDTKNQILTQQHTDFPVDRSLESTFSIASASEIKAEVDAMSAAEIREALDRMKLTTSKEMVRLIGQFPEYLEPVLEFIMRQRAKIEQGQITPRDVAKAYWMTIASIGADAINVRTLAETASRIGLSFNPAPMFLNRGAKGQATIRPEEAAAWWLGTEKGQRALDAIERGEIDEKAWEEGMALRDAFGRNDFRPTDKRAGGIGPIKAGSKDFNLSNVLELTDAINETRGDEKKLEKVLLRIKGVAEGKKGFIGHMLGLGSFATIDAVELNVWLTGKGETTRASEVAKRKVAIAKKASGSPALSAGLFSRIRKAINRLRTQADGGAKIPEEVAAHIIHHWIWDAAKGIQTTHEGLYYAMETYSIGIEQDRTGGTFSIAGVPGPVIMFSDRVIETADGGRIETFTVENENRNRTKQWKTHKTLRDVIAGTSGSRRIGDIPLWRGQLDIQHPRVAIVIGYTLDPSDLEMYYEDDASGGVVSVESTDALPGWEYREEFGVVVKEGFDGTLEEAETEYLAMTIEDWLKIIDFSHSSVKVAKFLRPDDTTNSIGLDDSPLSREIRARVRAPEQKAEVFSGMSERVAKVRQRFEQRRLAGDLDVDQSAEEALANLELEREQLQARHQQQIAEVRERVDRQARNEGQARRRNVEGARRASEVRDRGRTEIARLQTRQAKELAELDQQIARAEDDLKRARSTDARFDQLRDIATLEAIARSLPPAIRGKLSGSFRTLAQMDTSAKREDYLLDLLPKIESSLERYLQDLYRKGIRNVLKRGAVAVSDARTRGGKIGPAGHAIFDQAKAAMLIVGDDPDGMTAIEKVEQQTEEITRQIEASGEIDMEMLDELDGRRAALELFYDFQNADSARLAEGLDFLRSVYSDGRKAWLETLAARKAQRTERIKTLLRGMNHDRSRAGRAAAKRRDEKGSLGEWIMEFGISGSQTLRRLAERTDDPGVQQMVQDLEDAFGAAEALESDLNIADQQSLANALRRILGVKTEWGVASKLRELSTNDGKDVPVTSLEGRKTVEISVPINEAQALVNGETSKIASGKDKGTELSLAQRQQLEAMLEEHEATPEGDRRKIRVFKVSTVEAAGERVTLGKITQLEGLQLYLTMRQPDQAEKLEGMGYDEQTRKELEAWLQPRTLKLGEWMTSQLENDQSVLDELHRKEKGVALALVENYFPVRNDVARADHSGLSLDGQGQQQSGRATGFVKQRVTNSAEPAIVDALSVFLAHRAQVNFWKSHVTPIREWGGVLRDQKLADGVRQSMGQQYYNALRQRLDRIESGGRLKGGRVMGFDRFVKSLMRRMALSVLGMRLSTLMVNISAGMNVGLHMPVKDFVKGLVKVMKRPEAFREAWKSPAIRRRIQEGSTFEARIAKTSGPSKRPTIQTLESAAEKGVSPINYIDTGANTLGAAVIWEHTRQEALAAGMTEEQAAKQAEIAVERFFRHAAQPTSRLSRSEMELALLESPIGALFAMFVSEPRKNGAIAYMALRELATGLGTAGKGLAVQQAAVSLVAMIAVENVLRSLYDALVRADPEDEDTIFGRFWEKMFDAKAWSHRIATSHLTGIPLIGAGWEFFTANLINATDIPGNDVMAWNTSQNPLIRMIGKSKRAVRKIATGDSEDLVDDSVDAIQGAGLLPGVPLFSQLANVVEAGKGTYDSTWSEEGRVERFAYRAKKAYDEFPIRDEDGEIDRDLQEKRWIWYADYLESALLPHSKSFREKAIEKIKPAKAVRERMGLQ